MQRVLVVDRTGAKLMPCHPARARKLLTQGRARVFRHAPFTIQLTDRVGGESQTAMLKIDPGSRTTGLAVVVPTGNGWRLIWAAEIHHRGAEVHLELVKRAGVRGNRRSRKTRYRAPRFANRRRALGWLPPSLESRLANILTWVKRLLRWVPIGRIEVESVRFDTQQLVDPETSGTEYQQGTLAGYEVREYLLEKWQHRCAYCDATNCPLQIDHIVPRARGGSDRVSNLTLACAACNQRKGERDVRDFLASQPQRLATLLQTAQAPLRDAAAVNSTRLALLERLAGLGVPVQGWSSGRTKYNRVQQGYPKTHWIDAACVGAEGNQVSLNASQRPLTIHATGHGSRQMCLMNRYGFPRTRAKQRGKVAGFQTGDWVLALVPTGKAQGRHRGRVAIRARKIFRVEQVDDIPARCCRLLQRADGYQYDKRRR